MKRKPKRKSKSSKNVDVVVVDERPSVGRAVRRFFAQLGRPIDQALVSEALARTRKALPAVERDDGASKNENAA